MTKCLQCDFFENRHTSRRRFKIKRRWHRDGDVATKLGKIMEKLEIPDNGNEVRRCNYLDPATVKMISDYNNRKN